MIRFLIACLLLSMPVKPEMALRFKDVSIKQALSMANRFLDLGELPIPPSLSNGRVKKLEVEVRTNWTRVIVEGVHIQTDPPLRDQPLQWVHLLLDRRRGMYYLKAEALGGFVELEGLMPLKPSK